MRIAEALAVRLDLHRFDVLKAMRLSPPKTLEAERAFNKRLSDFLRQGFPCNFRYSLAESNKQTKNEESGDCEEASPTALS